MNSGLFASSAKGFQPTSRVASAEEILRTHAEVPEGLCLGCMNEYGYVIPHPCTRFVWAQQTLRLVKEAEMSPRPSWDEDTQEVDALRLRDRQLGAANGWNASTTTIGQVLDRLKNLDSGRR